MARDVTGHRQAVVLYARHILAMQALAERWGCTESEAIRRSILETHAEVCGDHDNR